MNGLGFDSTKIILQETVVILDYPDHLHIWLKVNRSQSFQTYLLVKTGTYVQSSFMEGSLKELGRLIGLEKQIEAYLNVCLLDRLMLGGGREREEGRKSLCFQL